MIINNLNKLLEEISETYIFINDTLNGKIKNIKYDIEQELHIHKTDYYYCYYINYLLLSKYINNFFNSEFKKYNDYKLLKYNTKYNTHQQNKIYKDKFKHYLILKNITGGTHLDDDKYHLLYNYEEKLIQINPDEMKCHDKITYIDSIENPYTCINIPTYKPTKENEHSYLQSYYSYLFSRGIRQISTDTFMKILSKYTNNNKLLFNYVFIELHLCIGYYMYTFNKTTKSKLSNEDIFLLYKGGNIIKTLIELYSSDITNATIKSQYEKYLETYNPSDWDYCITINNSNLLNDEFLNNITLVFTKAFIRIQHVIEKYINILLPESIFNELIDECNKKTIEIQEIIETFKINNNSIYNSPYNPSYNEKIIESIYNLKFVLSNTDKQTKGYSVFPDKNRYNRKLIYKSPLKEFEVLNNFKYSYLIYINNIFINTKHENIQFNLFRLKLYNSIMYNIKYKSVNLNPSTIQSLCGVELVDLSLSYNKNILKNIFNYIKNEENTISDSNNLNNKYMSINLLINEISITTQIPSILYMIVDIIYILFYDSLFPWADIKYEKRINRLINLVSLYYTSILKSKKEYASSSMESYITESKQIYETTIIIIKQIIARSTDNYEHKYKMTMNFFKQDANLNTELYIEIIKEIYNIYKDHLEFNKDLDIICIKNFSIEHPILNIIIYNILEMIVYIYYIYYYNNNIDELKDFKFTDYCYTKFKNYHLCDLNQCNIDYGVYYKFSQFKSRNLCDKFIKYIETLINLLTNSSTLITDEYHKKEIINLNNL
uniref:Uncharacterized protein n=1 Tax=viral metagenome TaxID=1070528 RepID=A0A6C0H7J0_9ZZZZ